VEYLTEADFQPEYPGSLPSAEHTRFFLELVNLCLIISDWLDLLRPGRDRRGRGSTLDRNSRALALLAELQQWHKTIPTTLQTPKSCTGFTLWTATLHVTYQAALLRFCTLLPEGTDTMYRAATEISNVVKDLDRQDLLGSLWNFGIHEFDLAMVLHARQANSKDPATSKTGMRNLQSGLPWARKLGSRSSVAQQAQMFYEDLVKKINQSATPTDDANRIAPAAEDAQAVDPGEAAEAATFHSLDASNASATASASWVPEMCFTDPMFQAQMMAHDGNDWGWDMYYDQARFQHQQQFPLC
jgi:hypothetical protein